MLKLKEVLWEITPECNKNCEYCGSRDIINKQPLCSDDLLSIAKQLADYGVEEVTITGGEPGLLAQNRPDDFRKIIKTLRDGGVNVKAVTNGKLVEDGVLAEDLWDEFDIFGISINTLEDIDNTNLEVIVLDENTMITNFGKHNIWDFDDLSKFAGEFKCWQVQLTMGDEMLNAEGINYLRNKIKSSGLEQIGCTIVLADNLQDSHVCGAGISCCSITYNGDMIACLSERSYGGIQKEYGNLLVDNIETIWENEFKDIRFKKCRSCCRDHIEYPTEGIKIPTIISTDATAYEPQTENNPNIYKPTVVLYGVVNPKYPNKGFPGAGTGGVMVYGAFNP